MLRIGYILLLLTGISAYISDPFDEFLQPEQLAKLHTITGTYICEDIVSITEVNKEIRELVRETSVTDVYYNKNRKSLHFDRFVHDTIIAEDIYFDKLGNVCSQIHGLHGGIFYIQNDNKDIEKFRSEYSFEYCLKYGIKTKGSWDIIVRSDKFTMTSIVSKVQLTYECMRVTE